MGDSAGSGPKDATPDGVTGELTQSAFVRTLIHIAVEVENFWSTGLDFRLKVLAILVTWLCINIILIKITWSCYGEKLSEMFMKQGTGANNQSSSEEMEWNTEEQSVQEQHLHRE